MDKDEATLLGALPQPAARRPPHAVAVDAQDPAGPLSGPATLPGMGQLYFAIEAQRSDARALIVQFLAAGRGDGASTVAASYARQAARRSAGAVLLIRCGEAAPGSRGGAAAGPGAFGPGPDLGSGLGAGPEWRKPCALDLFQAGLPLDGLPLDDGRLRVATLGEAAAASLDMRVLEGFAAALRRSFDLVVLDCAPLADASLDHNSLADASLADASLADEFLSDDSLTGALARVADGTVVVVAAGRTRRRGLQRTLAEIAGRGGQVVGLVLNRQRDWLPGWLRRLLG